MSEQKNVNTRPILADEIRSILSGDALKRALDFAEHLKANDMHYTGNHCEIHYKDKCACYIYLDQSCQVHGPWTIWTEGKYTSEHENVPMDKRMKEIAWANVSTCLNCGNSCNPGHCETIFGKDFNNVCNAILRFRNPDTETLECVKKLLLYRKYEIDTYSK